MTLIKEHLKNSVCWLAIFMAAWCGKARADIATERSIAYPGGGTAWAADPSGNSPFYSTGNLATSGNFSNHGAPAAAAGATASLLAETITLTNGAGNIGLSQSLIANTNYVVTGLSLLCSGGGTSSSIVSLHIFDVTGTITGLTSSAATYDFTTNGDLLGEGDGLTWTNSGLSGAEQQVYLGLENGPTTYGDQVILQENHSYAIEVWVPANDSGAFYWYKSSAAPQDIGGWFMAGANSSLSVPRYAANSSTFGFTGSSDHAWALALYGYPTNVAGSSNPSTNMIGLTNFIVDQFNDPGYGLSNSYLGTNNYAMDDEITNVWGNWFGGAWVSNSWDPTSDAQGNTNSGSLRIYADFSANNTQYVVYDYNNGINPPLDAATMNISNFQCDVRFDSSSASETNASVDGGVPFYGYLQFGTRTSSYGQEYFGGVTIAVTNTNWVHVNIPLNPADPNLASINNVLIHMYGPYYSPGIIGPSILWVDNIKFEGAAVAPTPPAPPTMSIQKAVPSLRIFAGSTANNYDREELSSVDQSQSWIGGSYPVTYSFTLLDAANENGFQTHIFLVPINYLASGNTVYNNEYVEYQSSNNLWLQLVGNTNGTCTANISWKTNAPNANPNIVAVSFTNSTAVGTWTVTFTGPNAGTVTAPGTNSSGTDPVPFTITDPNVATDFANPVVAYFGIQPNGTGSANEGAYVDYASMSTSGVAGQQIDDVFADDSSLNLSTWETNNSADAGSIFLVSSNTPVWVTWTVPAVNYGLGISPVVGPNATFMLPGFYNGYYDQPQTVNEGGIRYWSLIPSDCLPSNADPTQSNAFFRLSNPPPLN